MVAEHGWRSREHISERIDEQIVDPLEAKRGGLAETEKSLASCESFRIFVMCLHGLDILSIWVLFFSLLCATASAFQFSHLAKDLEVFVTNCMDNPRSCSARVDKMRVFEIACILCADHVFWYP